MNQTSMFARINNHTIEFTSEVDHEDGATYLYEKLETQMTWVENHNPSCTMLVWGTTPLGLAINAPAQCLASVPPGQRVLVAVPSCGIGFSFVEG